MALQALSFILLSLFGCFVHAYIDLGDATLPEVTAYTPTIPHHLHPTGYIARLGDHAMITAIAPSISLLPNGIFETYYSMHFQRQAPRRKIGKGIFERGVFASDPPFPTCDVCDASGNHLGANTVTSGTGSTSLPTCTAIPYGGVFRSPDPAQTTYCFDTKYTGVFSTSIAYTYQLPCCPSCAPNSTTTSFTPPPITTGVLVSTTIFSSNGTTLSFSATSSSYKIPTSSSSTTLLRSPSASSSSSSSRASLSMTTTSRLSSSIPSIGPTLASPSRSSSSTSSSAGSSVIVISSTTITIGPSSPGLSSSQNTITVITATPYITTSAASSSFNVLAPDTIIGCGTAVNGCGTVIGSGTVFLGPLGMMRVTSSGTAIGCAPTVIGCGTMIATTGTFTGSATIYGCGTASGTATMIGAGTVWPAIGGGLISFISSGRITGSGSVVGCGTLIGSGAFTATAPFSVSLPPTPTKTVEVYVSYCPTTMPGYGMPRLDGNLTDSHTNNTLSNAPYRLLNSTNPTNLTYPFLNTTMNTTTPPTNDVIPACKQCPATAVCCAPNAACNPDGTCPYWAIEAMGYIKFGLNQAAVRNHSDGTQGPEVTDQELRVMDGVGSVGSGEAIGDGVLGGLAGGKVETGPKMVANLTSGLYRVNSTKGNGNDTSPFNGFVVKDDNVFFSQ